MHRRFSSTLLQYSLIGMVFWMMLAGAQSARIWMDGRFGDWQALTPVHTDPTGDQQTGSIDFRRLWIANDENYLFLRIEVGGEINLQDLNDITLYIDTDDDNGTGIPVHGIGAELEWDFGARSGRFLGGQSIVSITHRDIGLVTAPTVSSTQFEVAIDRHARPDGQYLLFPQNHFVLVLQDRGPGGDVLPDAAGGVAYTISADPLPPIVDIPIAPQHPGSIRLLTYNVQNDGLFDGGRLPRFTRILQALNPQIIGVQEIYGHNAQQLANQMESILPSGSGQQWYTSGVSSDVYVASRYPITRTWGIQGTGSSADNGAFQINLRPDFDSDLLLIVAHPPCCGNDNGRQLEVDAIMAFIRDAKSPGGAVTVAPNTPIVIVGDLNLVGDSQQLTTLLTGDIVNTGQFGPPFDPDWDNTAFADLAPRIPNLPQFFTWYSPFSSFAPGRLDFVIYSNSVLDFVQRLVLFTPSLPADTLSAYNLLFDDATAASDHLPVVGDFVVLPTVGVEEPPANATQDFVLEQNYPNPFNPITAIAFYLPHVSRITLHVYDIAGHRVRTLVSGSMSPGRHRVIWDGTDDSGRTVASGVYLYRLKVDNSSAGSGRGFVQTRKMVLIR